MAEAHTSLVELCELLRAWAKKSNLSGPILMQDAHEAHALKPSRTWVRYENFDPLQLALATIEKINHKDKQDLDAQQQTSLDKIAAWNPKCLEKDIHVDDLLESEAYDLIKSFSRVFLLKDILRARIDFEWEEIEADEDGGVTFGQQRHKSRSTSIIMVDPRNWADEKGVKDHKTNLLSTLFHECLHAYFALFSCDGTRHDWEGVCGRRGSPWNGSGHFVSWVHLAAGIDISLEKLLGQGMDLSVMRSVMNESAEEESEPFGSFPAQEWLRMFGLFGWSGVDSLVRKLRGDELKEFATVLKQHTNVVLVFLAEYEKETSRKGEE